MTFESLDTLFKDFENKYSLIFKKLEKLRIAIQIYIENAFPPKGEGQDERSLNKNLSLTQQFYSSLKLNFVQVRHLDWECKIPNMEKPHQI